MELLFLLAYWQGMVKLRLHTEKTLAILEDITRSLGIALRAFRKETSSAFQTKELLREAAARCRKSTQAKGKQKQGSATRSKSQEDHQQSPHSRLPKALNLNTYKLHSLGDYANIIRQYGTTDSFSTQLVSMMILPLHTEW